MKGPHMSQLAGDQDLPAGRCKPAQTQSDKDLAHVALVGQR